MEDDNKVMHKDVPYGEYVSVEILDSGDGIDETILERIFDPPIR